MKIRDISFSFPAITIALVLGGCAARATYAESRPATEASGSIFETGDETPTQTAIVAEPAAAEDPAHPLGGPPGQTGEHPQGEPGQATEPAAAQAPAQQGAAGEPAAEPTDVDRGHGNDADRTDEENPAARRRARRAAGAAAQH